MPAHASAERRTEKLDFRISPSAKAKLQAAAAIAQQNMSDFVMESALARADEALAGRKLFLLDAKTWKTFQAALDEPIRPMPQMKLLLSEPGFFDSDPGK